MNYTIIDHVSSSLDIFVYQSSREWLGKAISRDFQICYLTYLFSTNYQILVVKGGGGGVGEGGLSAYSPKVDNFSFSYPSLTEKFYLQPKKFQIYFKLTLEVKFERLSYPSSTIQSQQQKLQELSRGLDQDRKSLRSFHNKITEKKYPL